MADARGMSIATSLGARYCNRERTHHNRWHSVQRQSAIRIVSVRLAARPRLRRRPAQTKWHPRRAQPHRAKSYVAQCWCSHDRRAAAKTWLLAHLGTLGCGSYAGRRGARCVTFEAIHRYRRIAMALFAELSRCVNRSKLASVIARGVAFDAAFQAVSLFAIALVDGPITLVK